MSCGGDSKESSTAHKVDSAITEIKDSIVGMTNGNKPDWAPTIDGDMWEVIQKLESYHDKPVAELSPAQARKNHTPTDAVNDLIQEKHIEVPAPKVDTVGKNIAVKGGEIHLRIYTPKEGKAPYPVIVYYHGGGFVIADLDVYDASAKALSEQSEAIVVSVAYRLGPEHKFPVAHEDAYAAYQWVVKNAISIKGDPKRIALAGESAGGNLALNVSIKARDNKFVLPVYQVLVYPVANSDMESESYIKYAQAKPLNKDMMKWFVKHYLKDATQAADKRISLVNADLKGLPATAIITAEIDPLQAEGLLLADKLKAAGVEVDNKNYNGVTHEFFGMAAIVSKAKDAQGYAAKQLKQAFKK
ncbi:MAG: alpha/beta hydrolase [Cytophagaceae bacterium]|nr:alpha/beta hydrolase [Cytophagaceae bacterium]